jgi:hypothetical protein
VEFDGKDGSFLYAQADYSIAVEGQHWGPDRPTQCKQYLAILVGECHTYKHDTGHVVLIVEEHKYAAEKVGTVRITTNLVAGLDKLKSNESTVVRGLDGVLHATDCLDIEQIVWTRRRVKLG